MTIAMDEMEVEQYCEESSPTQERNERGVKRTWPLDINEDEVRKERLTRSTGSHKLTIHCIRADTYAYSVMKKDSPSIAQVVAKRRRLTNDEAERVIQTFTF